MSPKSTIENFKTTKPLRIQKNTKKRVVNLRILSALVVIYFGFYTPNFDLLINSASVKF